LSLILIIIVLVLLFGGGGGYYAHGRYGLPGVGGVVGLIGVALKGYTTTFNVPNPIHFPLTDNPIFSVAAFAALAFSLYYFARKPLKK